MSIRMEFRKGWFVAFISNSNLVALGRTALAADCKARQCISGISKPFPPQPPLRAA